MKKQQIEEYLYRITESVGGDTSKPSGLTFTKEELGKSNRTIREGKYGLLPRQQNFVNAVVAGHNYTEAARIAGYKGTPGNSLWILCNKWNVKQAIKEGIEEKRKVAATVGLDKDSLLRELMKIHDTTTSDTARMTACRNIFKVLGYTKKH